MDSQKVLIVHGDEETYISECCEVVRSLGLEPEVVGDLSADSVIRAVKSGQIKAALVLFRATDIGKSDADRGFKKRASQQLVLELGALTAFIGGRRIVVVRDPRVDPPTNMHGALEIVAEPESAWKVELEKAVKTIGVGPENKKPYWRRRKSSKAGSPPKSDA